MKSLLTIIALAAVLQMQARENAIYVEAGNARSLLNAIEQANRQNADSTASQLFILIPDGYYDLGEQVLTTLSGHHVALVGQSMQNTVIRNAPPAANEGIGKTAVIRNTGSDNYFSDLTLRNDLDYYHSGSAGRAVCLQDKGTRTICQRVCMLSYQDTYYSDNEQCQHYFDESEIHGTIDFICGAGDVFFNRCTIVAEPRTAEGKGRDVIAAPRTANTPWGYIFESCTFRSEKSDFYYARGWHSQPRLTLLRTTLLTPGKLAVPRFDEKGMRTVESLFYEYKTCDAEGRDITPKSNVVTFTLNDQRRSHETILSDVEARKYQLENVFPDWRPEKKALRIAGKAARLKKEAWGQ